MERSRQTCEVADYISAQLQTSNVFEALRGTDITSSGVTCPESCAAVQVIDKGVFPKSTLECPKNGLSVRLGRIATYIRHSTV